jgi:hypothetical protein
MNVKQNAVVRSYAGPKGMALLELTPDGDYQVSFLDGSYKVYRVETHAQKCDACARITEIVGSYECD